ncbi:MAG: LytTR family DNA-binding domain-containing protein [Bacteroidota bacterium]
MRNTYKDRRFILAGTIIVTLCLTFIGTDHTLNEVLSDRIIFKKLLLNSLTILIAWLGIRQLIIFFDRRMPWDKKTSEKRWSIQISITLLFVIAVFLIQLYSRTLFIPEWKLFSKTVWSVDFPLALLFGLSFNFLYYHWWTQNRRQIVDKMDTVAANWQDDNTPSNIAQSISVKKGRRTILIPSDEIAYAFRVEEFNYLVAKNGEKYLLDTSLNALEQELNPLHFFRLNRQLLVHRTAIQSFQILPNRHLEITLQPKLKGNSLVNKNKAAGFKKWMKSS